MSGPGAVTTTDQAVYDVAGVPLWRCADCERHFVNERTRCPRGPEHRLEPVSARGGGQVYSWTVTHVAMSAAFADRVPYATVLVELDEGVRVLALSEIPIDQLAIGLPVRVSAEQTGTGGPTLRAHPAPGQEEVES